MVSDILTKEKKRNEIPKEPKTVVDYKIESRKVVNTEHSLHDIIKTLKRIGKHSVDDELNCGGCGYSGCEGYAKAVEQGSAPANLCKPGGPEAVTAISEIMGIEAVVAEREYAYVKCNGNCDACSDKFIYIGTKSCAAIEKFYNGKGNCSFGCHGMGDCAAVCDNNAIRIENGIAIIIPELCGGCGK